MLLQPEPVLLLLPDILQLQLGPPILHLLRDHVGTARSMEIKLRTLFWVRKLAVWQVELRFQPAGFSMLNPGPEPEPELCSFSLLFLRDSLSKREFLVNSGASVSVFSGPRSDSSGRVSLLTADGSQMVCGFQSTYIPGHFSSLLYLFLSSEQISWNTLISSSTSKKERLWTLSVRSLWFSMLLLLLSLPFAVLPSSLLRLRSRNSFRSSLMYSAGTASRPQNLAMVSAITSSLVRVLRCILNLVDLTPRSSLPPRRSFPPSRRPELS